MSKIKFAFNLVMLGLMASGVCASAKAEIIFFGKAEYTVPVSDELRPYSKFKLENVRVRKIDGDVKRISYVLPRELIGGRYRAELAQVGDVAVDGTVHLQSEYGDKADCLKDICQVRYYSNLPIDIQARDKAISRISKSPEEMLMRQQVASAFMGDPAGVIELD